MWRDYIELTVQELIINAADAVTQTAAPGGIYVQWTSIMNT